MVHESSKPAGVVPPKGYSHVTVARGTRIVFIAGQVALDEAGNLIGGNSLELQAERAFENLERCLASIGATMNDVTKINTYTVGYRPEHIPILAAVRRRHLPAENPPAVTGVGVDALGGPGLLYEVDAIAVLTEDHGVRVGKESDMRDGTTSDQVQR